MTMYEVLRGALRFMQGALRRGYGMTIVLIPPEQLPRFYCPCCGNRISGAITGAGVLLGTQCHNRACYSRQARQGAPLAWALTESVPDGAQG